MCCNVSFLNLSSSLMNKMTNTIRQTAGICGTSENTIRKLVHEGSIPHSLDRNGSIRLSITAISQLIEAMQKQVICLYPDAASTSVLDKWMNKHSVGPYILISYNPSFGPDDYLKLISDTGPFSKIIAFHSHAINRDSLSALLSLCSRNSADLLLANSISLP
jgi:hypothetical protein